jgi:hypothetical protein
MMVLVDMTLESLCLHRLHSNLGIESRTSATAAATGIEGVNDTTLHIPTLKSQLYINSRWLAVVTTVRNLPETELTASP